MNEYSKLFTEHEILRKELREEKLLTATYKWALGLTTVILGIVLFFGGVIIWGFLLPH